MHELRQEFDAIVEYVGNADGDVEFSNNLKLEMYALYKQATEGDVSGKRPGMLDVVGRAKFDAWKKMRGTTAETAMQRYIDNVNKHRS